jgi:hypothetical protein
MNTIRPTIAVGEFAEHTFDEIRFAKNLKNSVDDFFKVLNGEKKGRNAKTAMLELMEESEVIEIND